MISNYVTRFAGVIKNKGIGEAINRILQRVLSVPVALIILLLWPFKKIRLIQLYSSRIGQFGGNTYLMLCALDSDDFPDEKKCIHLYYAQTVRPICNTFLHKMFARVIPILPAWGPFWGYVNNNLISTLKEKYNTPFKKIFESS